MGIRAIAVAAVLGASTLSTAGAATSCDDRIQASCSNYPILNPGEAVETESAQARSPLKITGGSHAKRMAAKRGRHATRLAAAKHKLKQARRERTKVAAVTKRRGARPGVRLATIAKRSAAIEVASADDDLTFDKPAAAIALPRPRPVALAAVPFDAATPEEEAAAAAATAQAVEAVETTGRASLEERFAEAVIPSAQAAPLKPLGVVPATVRPAEFAVAASAPGQFDLTPLRAAFMAFGGLLVLGTVARLVIA